MAPEELVELKTKTLINVRGCLRRPESYYSQLHKLSFAVTHNVFIYEGISHFKIDCSWKFI